MKKSDDHPDAKDGFYAAMMAVEVQKQPKRPVSVVQCASTLKNMAGDDAWRNRPLPTKSQCQVASSPEEMDQYIRKISHQERAHFYQGRNIAAKRLDLRELIPTVSSEKRLIAVSKIMQIDPVAPTPPKESWLKRMWLKVTWNYVRECFTHVGDK